jgi:Tol biopolymer transport system component
MNNRFSERLASLAEGAVPTEPNIPALKRLTRRRRLRRRVGAAIAVPAIALAVVLPVRALMELGEDVVGGPSGPGDLIAFSKQVDEDRYEIWVVSSNGSDPHRIDIALPMATDPAWSPDGATIAFSGNVESNTEPNDIYLVNPDGTGLRDLTNAPEGILNTKPSWSPDGSHLVFSRLDGRESGSGHSGLVILDLEAGNEETVSLPADFYQAIGPVWSPDGSKIAFTANRGSIVGPYILDAETGELVRIVPDRHAGSDAPGSPSWSPDGSRIAFADDGDIFSVSLEDMSVAQLTGSPAMETAPSWSPDGRIVYLSGASRPIQPCTLSEGAPEVEEEGCAQEADLLRQSIWDNDVFVINADGSGRVQITSGGGVGYSPFGPAAPSWQPIAATTEPGPIGPSPSSTPSPPPPEEAEAADVATYVLSDFGVGPYSDPHTGEVVEGVASVQWRVNWSSDRYPGDHECAVHVYDASGVVIGERDFQLTALTQGDLEPTKIPVSGSIVGATADGSCRGERLDTPVAYRRQRRTGGLRPSPGRGLHRGLA